jgi:hypothetical protein
MQQLEFGGIYLCFDCVIPGNIHQIAEICSSSKQLW